MDTFSHSIFEYVTNKLTNQCTMCTKFFHPQFHNGFVINAHVHTPIGRKHSGLCRNGEWKAISLNEFKVWNRFGRRWIWLRRRRATTTAKWKTIECHATKSKYIFFVFNFLTSKHEWWCRAVYHKCVCVYKWVWKLNNVFKIHPSNGWKFHCMSKFTFLFSLSLSHSLVFFFFFFIFTFQFPANP